MYFLSRAGAAAVAWVLLLGSVEARVGGGPRYQLLRKGPPHPVENAVHEGLMVESAYRPMGGVQLATFQQLIDHKNPSLGTFSQRYWYNADYYAGPGAPVVVRAPEEGDGWAAYANITTQPGMMGKTVRGAIVTLEHRYYGESSPFQNLTTANLQYLTLDNAMQDLIYFAKNVRLPFDLSRTSAPDRAPWVLSGCSYSGAVTYWIQRLNPGVFWAYHCSSAVVESITNFSQYFRPIEEGMPANCSADLRRAISHVDQVLSSRDVKAQNALKAQFGLQNLTHNDDFVDALSHPLGYWQNIVFFPFNESASYYFYEFCDYIENVFPDTNHSRLPGPNGVGTEKAVGGFARFMREIFLPGLCASYPFWKDKNTVACLNMDDASNPIYHDLTVENDSDRQWQWFLCNEPFEWWQVAGRGDNGLISKFLGASRQRAQCEKLFPRQGNHTYGLAEGRSSRDVNVRTGGWDVGKTERVMWVNGEYDPWREATVSSDTRPGGPLQSTPQAPVWVIPKASHCQDFLTKNAESNPELLEVFNQVLAQTKMWVDEFYVVKGRRPPQ